MMHHNLGMVERLVRIVVLPMLLLVAAFAVGAGTAKGTLPLTLAFALIVTGVVGHCPLRAIVAPHHRPRRTISR
jgi:hypothetical protein